MILIAAPLVAVSFSEFVPLWRLLAWALPVMAMAWFNAVLSRTALKGLDGATAEGLEQRQQWLCCSTLVNQTLMGATVWWLGWGQPAGIATVATTVQLLYLAGAMVNASTHPRTFVPGAWINVSAAALYWIFETEYGLAVGFSLFAVGGILTKFSGQINADFRESLKMRFENLELVKQLEAEKRSAQEANAAKSRFLAAASHDLRQPLHALMLIASLLHRAPASEVPRMVSQINEAAKSLDKLFEGLLDISKLETGAVVPKFQPVNVGTIAQALVREYLPQCQAKGVGLSLQGQDVWVLTDAFLLERLIRNLLDNAVKYTERGEVRLELERVDGEVEVRVVDTGVGIAASALPHVFEEYFQGHNPARDPMQGTGLGLAIVRRVSDLLNVKLWLDSNPGRGTACHLRMPCAPFMGSAAIGHGVDTAVSESVKGTRVWLIEDNEMVRDATVQALRSWGCEVSAWAGIPRGDLRHLGPDPHVLITDLRLAAGETGVDAIEHLRQHWPELPATIMTGDPYWEWGHAGALPRVTLMQKPVKSDALVQWLASARLS